MKFFFRHYILSGKNQIKTDVLTAKWAIIFIIAYFVCLRKLFYSICPVVIITGIPCPACGMTRAFFQLLHMDFNGAFETHPFIYVIVILFLIFAFNRYVFLKKTPEWLKWITILCFCSMIIFYIWRMMIYFPTQAPMNYYSDNLISKILRVIKIH